MKKKKNLTATLSLNNCNYCKFYLIFAATLVFIFYFLNVILMKFLYIDITGSQTIVALRLHYSSVFDFIKLDVNGKCHCVFFFCLMKLWDFLTPTLIESQSGEFKEYYHPVIHQMSSLFRKCIHFTRTRWPRQMRTSASVYELRNDVKGPSIVWHAISLHDKGSLIVAPRFKFNAKESIGGDKGATAVKGQKSGRVRWMWAGGNRK